MLLENCPPVRRPGPLRKNSFARAGEVQPGAKLRTGRRTPLGALHNQKDGTSAGGLLGSLPARPADAQFYTTGRHGGDF